MPRIEKLVPVDGRLGVVLDVPANGDSVTIYTDEELRAVLKRERASCAALCRELADTWAKTEAEQDALERAAYDIEAL